MAIHSVAYSPRTLGLPWSGSGSLLQQFLIWHDGELATFQDRVSHTGAILIREQGSEPAPCPGPRDERLERRSGGHVAEQRAPSTCDPRSPERREQVRGPLGLPWLSLQWPS